MEGDLTFVYCPTKTLKGKYFARSATNEITGTNLASHKYVAIIT